MKVWPVERWRIISGTNMIFSSFDHLWSAILDVISVCLSFLFHSYRKSECWLDKCLFFIWLLWLNNCLFNKYSCRFTLTVWRLNGRVWKWIKVPFGDWNNLMLIFTFIWICFVPIVMLIKAFKWINVNIYMINNVFLFKEFPIVNCTQDHKCWGLQINENQHNII